MKKTGKISGFTDKREKDTQKVMTFEEDFLSLATMQAAVESLSWPMIKPKYPPLYIVFVHPEQKKELDELLDSIKSEPIDILKYSKHLEKNNVLDVLPETGILKSSNGGFDTDANTPMLDPDTGDDDVGYDTPTGSDFLP